MKPSIGRIVHYVAYGTPGGEFQVGACRAAIVTEVTFGGGGETVGLCVLNPTGQYFSRAIPHDEGITDGDGNLVKAAGTWHWPERVE